MTYNCPNCKKPLTKRGDNKGSYWACESCGGRGITFEALYKILPGEIHRVHDLWVSATTGVHAQRRPCPTCEDLMVNVPSVLGPAGITLDVCLSCQLVWFDPGEFERLPSFRLVHELPEDSNGNPDLSLWQWIPYCLGLPVELRAPVLARRPWFTWGLVVALIIASAPILIWSSPEVESTFFGLMPAYASRAAGLTFLTSIFIHGSFFHLLGNLYFLLLVGDNVEDFIGPIRCAALFVASAFLGSFAHTLLNWDSEIPLIGASGGISGLVAFYGLQFPRARLAVLIRWTIPLRVRAQWGLLLWLGLQLLGLVLQVRGATQVSYAAHIAGASAGALLWFRWRRAPWLRRLAPSAGSAKS